MEDRQIVELYWQRDEEAIVQTVQKYQPYCYAIARNLLGDPRDAEECVNDTWVGAWNAMPTQRPDRLGAFLGKITRRGACTRLRAARAEKRGGGELPLILEELEHCLPSAASPAQEAEGAELERAVGRFLHTLPPRECDIFLRRYWFAEPLEEIARRFGLPLNTVKSSLFRSRKKLRRYLEKEDLL